MFCIYRTYTYFYVDVAWWRLASGKSHRSIYRPDN